MLRFFEIFLTRCQRKDLVEWRRIFPQERVAMVRQKLVAGANPAAITVRELRKLSYTIAVRRVGSWTK